MAATGTIQILGTILNLPGVGIVNIGPLTITSAAAVGERRSPLTLNNGSNVFTWPAATVAIIIIPPATNTNALTLKGNAADVGLPISKTQPTVIAMTPPAAGNLVIDSVGVTAGVEIIFV